MATLYYMVEFVSNQVGYQRIEVQALNTQGAEQIARNMYGKDIQIYSTNPYYK
jgi:hypothetical protein